MNKKVVANIKLILPARKANPSPPIGPILGQYGLNLMEFCKSFNSRTQEFKESIPIPVNLVVYEDKTFEYIIKTPDISFFIKKIIENAKILKTNTDIISIKQIYEIAKIKKEDPNLSHINIKSICKMIIGTIHSMNIRIGHNLKNIR